MHTDAKSDKEPGTDEIEEEGTVEGALRTAKMVADVVTKPGFFPMPGRERMSESDL